ncbi:MAG: hypothetical protein H0W25_12955, partial [Acidimicrobiia bacterium]|nr:hypothetical protein [Acidimicrobiia bacterium]
AGQLPALVELVDVVDDEGNPSGRRDLRFELTALDEAVPEIGGLPWLGWTFVVPRFDGPGTYDVAAATRAIEEAGEYGADPTDCSFALGGHDEPYYWHADAGASTVEALGPDGRHLKLHLAMDSSGGSIVVVAELNLPA